ncbi:NUDIX domain-containing protein [Heliobacterium undosum]|uniref:8-oxo-dGTP diphosphatase n=1 Tax=Heliomicrobium undosum TaxID=121734 RepID=A0A845KZ95_9FIRM|nr:(deoxy)nucleoside triphosphate pyrophosphohydrolase [Heliomicrobium undosum]MZP29033.1 NUDIX domain-containing protein [Heliomicrobium undosum]
MVHVVAAILVRDQRIFIAQRPADDALEFKWEFPGGKIEAGESPEASLRREMIEEFQMDIAVGDFFGESLYTYPKGTVRLLAYWATWIQGEPQLLAHADCRWVTVDELNQYEFAPADIPFVERLKESGSLPRSQQ